MNKSDKNSFLIIGFVVGSILLAILFTIGFKRINPMILGLLIIIVQFVLTPIVNKYYYQACGYTPSLSRMIPFYGELSMFDTSYAKATLGILIAIIVSLAVSCIPIDVFTMFLPHTIATSVTFYVLLVAIFLYIVFNIVRGIGLFGVYSNIQKIHREMTGVTERTSVYSIFVNLTLFIPVVRLLGIINMYNILLKVVKFNGYTKGDNSIDSFVEEGTLE